MLKSILTAAILALALTVGIPAGAQEREAAEAERAAAAAEEQQRAAEQERAAEQQQAAEQERAAAQEAALLAARRGNADREDAILAEQQLALEEQQRQLAAARTQLELARSRMEEAARQISRLSSAGPGGTWFTMPVAPDAPAAVGRARIGANIQNADAGALILGVTPGGPADTAGIMSGDVITSVNGTSTIEADREPVAVVFATLADVEPGAVVPVDVERAGEVMHFEVETTELPGFVRVMRNFRGPGDFDITLPDFADLPNVRAGEFGRNFGRYFALTEFFAASWRDMELVELTEELGEYFGTDEGLLVVRAPETDDLELRDGDVILEISGRTPNSPEHALRILGSFAPGETLEFEIMRRQRRQTIEYEMPDPAAADD